MVEWFAVLDPKGAVGLAERGLMLHAVEFMLIVALPVYFLLFFFAWRYRAGNTKATYMPKWEHGKLEELAWWVIPLEIVLVLGAMTWFSTHQLDPQKALGAEPLTIEVVALEWKWLFIYPEQNIATLNYAVLPVDRPVAFKLTADAPMNSFWIPRLGGQLYAMTGMATTLNLIADEPGTYRGLSANYSGDGFAKMQFNASAVPAEDFAAWVEDIQTGGPKLTHDKYRQLAEPSVPAGPSYFASVEDGLFESVIAQYNDARSPLRFYSH